MFKKIVVITAFAISMVGVGSVAQASFRVQHHYPQSAHGSQSSNGDLWSVLQHQFKLNHYEKNPAVKAQIDWFLKRKKYIYKLAENAQPYLYYILTQVEKRKLPVEMVLLPMIESAYDPFAFSSAGASGLWQMMPGTASGFGLKQNWWYDGRRDIVASTNAALDYLSYLQNFFNGNWLLAIAAYDSGEGTVLSATRKNIAKGKPTDFWSLKLPRETQAYIPKLLALAEIISKPSKYHVPLPPTKNQPYMTQVDVGSQIDLQQAAKLSGLSLKELLKLNPGYNRWATAPDGPYLLVLPIENVAKFKANLAKLPKSKRVSWKRYTVEKGDSLGKIAHKFHTTTKLLKQVNKLNSDVIQIGDTLFIPLSMHRLPSDVIDSAKKYVDLEEAQKPGPQKVVHVVKKGDSLWSVAKKYHVTTAAVRYWNGLKYKEPITPGQSLIFWLRPKAQHTASGQKVVKAYYRVKPGDTLGKIAKKYNTNAMTIQFVNQLDSEIISIGQKLLIYKNLKNHYYGEPLQVSYTVQNGDTLSKIAYDFDTNPKLIKQLNILTSNLLRVGQEIVVVPHALPTVRKRSKGDAPKQMVYIVENQDNLYTIAKKFKVSVSDITKWNPRLEKNSLLQSGEIVFIYQ